ncbi:hypothetical protein FQN57_005007 [Myotisia sp. PD_48]|nr:hypothetical protein FQN57_005007 [Myotisia sp. PD_48]
MGVVISSLGEAKNNKCSHGRCHGYRCGRRRSSSRDYDPGPHGATFDNLLLAATELVELEIEKAKIRLAMGKNGGQEATSAAPGLAMGQRYGLDGGAGRRYMRNPPGIGGNRRYEPFQPRHPDEFDQDFEYRNDPMGGEDMSRRRRKSKKTKRRIDPRFGDEQAASDISGRFQRRSRERPQDDAGGLGPPRHQPWHETHHPRQGDDIPNPFENPAQ